jgi:hypothetical protein
LVSRVHFIQFPNVEKAVFDTGLYALFVKDKKWSWITNPHRHREEWRS